MPLSPKTRVFWPIVATVFLADCATKAVAVQELSPAHVPHPVLGQFLRFTLGYNPAGAMSLSLGSLSRPLLSLVAVLALAGLLR